MPDKKYEKLGIKSDADVNALIQGVDLDRLKHLFYKGHRSDIPVANKNPNDSYNNLITYLRNGNVPEPQIQQTVEKFRAQEQAARIPVTEDELKAPVAALAYGVKQKFKKQIGRDPTQEEVAYVMNNVAPDQIGSTVNINDIDPKGFSDAMVNQYGVPDLINSLSPKFRLVDQTNLKLKNLGQSLPQDVISKLLASDTAPEDAQTLADTYVQTVKEKRLEESIPQLQQEESSAIDAFEKQLTESQGRFLNEEIAPSIISQLNARGILQGGDLAASLSEAGAGLQRQIAGQVAPLRANSSLGAIKAKGENILRGALEAGQSLDSAMAFARNMLSQGRQQNFMAGQNELNRAAQEQMFQQQMALQMAMTNASSGSGMSGLDYFLAYGLPTLGTIGGAFLGGPIGAALLGGAAGAGGTALRGSLNSSPGNLRMGSGFTPRSYQSYTGNWNPTVRKYT